MYVLGKFVVKWQKKLEKDSDSRLSKPSPVTARSQVYLIMLVEILIIIVYS